MHLILSCLSLDFEDFIRTANKKHNIREDISENIVLFLCN